MSIINALDKSIEGKIEIVVLVSHVNDWQEGIRILALTAGDVLPVHSPGCEVSKPPFESTERPEYW